MAAALLAASTSDTAAAKARKPNLQLVIDYPYQMWNRAGTKVHLVVFDGRFRPVQGAVAKLGARRLGRTDRHGTLVFHFRSRKGWRGGRIVVRKTLRGVPVERSIKFEAYRRTASFEKQRVYLYTDRTMYRPRGKLRARVIGWTLRQRYRPSAGRTAKITLRNSSGDVASKTVTLDSFGTGHVVFDLTDLEPVEYQLTAEVGKASHERKIKLAWFKRPELEIDQSFPSYFTARTRRLVGTIRLKTLLGQSPKGGTMKVEMKGDDRALATRTVKLDGRKGYAVAFTRREVQRFARTLKVDQNLTLQIDVTQPSGAESNLEHELAFVDNPYKAVLELDRDTYRVGQEVVALVKLLDLDENPVPRKRVALHVTKTKRIWSRTNRYGIATFRFQAPDHPDTELELNAYVPDVKDSLANANMDIKERGSMDSVLGKAQVVQGGWVPITVTLRKGFRPLEKVLHCDVTDFSGAIVAAVTIPIRRQGSRWVAKGRFRAPSWGSMLLTMFTVGARESHLQYFRRKRKPTSSWIAGLLLEGQQVTVHPNQALKLTLTGVPRQAKPGTPVRYGVSVRGPDGKLRDALVGAMLVDKNILALGDSLKKVAPGSIFYNAQLRVMATTGAKILTWPVVARTWGCNQHDIALPPFPFQEGSGNGTAKGETDDEECSFGGSGSGSGGAYGIGGLGYGGSGGPPPTFTVRKRFRPSSYWAPSLRARGGLLASRFQLPDTISNQELILVASDKRGGVGVLRQTVTVVQPLAIRLDLPPKMVDSDELEVLALLRNYTAKPLQLKIGISTQRLTVLKMPTLVTVPVGQEVPIRIRIRATGVGAAALKIGAWQGKQGDVLERTLEVLPSGPPTVKTHRGVVQKGRSALWDILRKPNDQALQATLKLDFPNVIPVLQSIQRVIQHPSLGGDTSASVLRSVAQVLRYKARFGLGKEQDLKLVELLIRGSRWLLKQQSSSGAFSYWRHGQDDAHHTAYVLETLLDLRRVGIDVPAKAIREAAWYLLTYRAADGLWDTSRAAFWEGKSRDVRNGLSAEIFRAAARASHLKCRFRPNSRLVAVAKQMRAFVDGKSRDPRTVAAALEGLHALYSRCLTQRRQHIYHRGAKKFMSTVVVQRKLSAAHRRWLVRGAKRLLQLKGRRYWEPSWFSAYGGTLEATATALTMLARLDRPAFRSHIRSGLRYLLERRHSWGAWHNERGTAATIRALLELGAGSRREVASARVSVLVNGKVVRKIEIDPRDPYGSAINLRHLRLSGLLARKRNRVEVRYSGRLKVAVRLEERRWSKGARRPSTKPGPPARRPRVRLLAPRTATLGRPFFAILEVAATLGHGGTVIALGLPTNVRPVKGALARLRRDSGAYRVQLRGRVLSLHLPRHRADRRLLLNLVPHVGGRSRFQAPRIAPLAQGPISPALQTIGFAVR